MNEIREEDWPILYHIADKSFSTRKAPSYMDKHDFRQLCVLSALRSMYKLPTFDTLEKYFRSVVYYASKKMYRIRSKTIQKDRSSGEIIQLEILLADTSLTEDDIQFHSVTVDNVTTNDLLVSARKLLTPLEYEIMILIYSGKSREVICKELGISDWKYRKAQKKLRELAE